MPAILPEACRGPLAHDLPLLDLSALRRVGAAGARPDRWVFIDWDNAGPGSRLWDLAYAAHGFVGMAPGNDAADDADRLAALVDGYALTEDDRERLVRLPPRRTRAMFDLLVSGHRTGTQPWCRLYDEGHADHWGPTADYVQASSGRFRDALLRH